LVEDQRRELYRGSAGAFRTSLTAPAMLRPPNSPRFGVGIFFSLPVHFAIAGGVNCVLTMGCNQEEIHR